MQFQDAVKLSIEKFLDGKMPNKLAELKEGGVLYHTPDYFDQLEEELLGKPVEKDKGEKDAK
tara:strand:+ start:815 stop:1000 length:186 start_codon:yes stop_codon:yes gene_type:complete